MNWLENRGKGRVYSHMRAILLLLFLCVTPSLYCQVWQWGRYGGGSGADSAGRIAVAPDGDVVVTVSFQGSARFDGVAVSGIGQAGIAVLRYAPGGGIRWGAANGGSGTVIPAGVAVDRGGSSYVVGSFTRTISFGGTVLASNGDYDVFIAKLSPAGTWIWARSGGGTEADIAGGIVVDSLDRPIIVGTFSQGARFDTAEIGVVGGSDLFIAKYESTGQLLWIVDDGGPGDERAIDVGVDATGAIAVVGEVEGRGVLGGTDLGASAMTDIVVGRYSRDGLPDWGLRLGGDAIDAAGGIAVDPFGNITIVGSFIDSIDLGSTTIVGPHQPCAFLVRMNARGEVRWGVGGDGGPSRGVDVSIAPNGTAVMIANFLDSMRIGSLLFASLGGDDVALVTIDPSGGVIWGDYNPLVGVTRGGSVAFDRAGELYAAGTYSRAARFGSVILPDPSAFDVFLIRYGADAAVFPGVVPTGPFCPGTILHIPYTVAGGFLGGNLFSVELSDASGSFANPSVIGARASTLSGTIVSPLPADLPPGSRYRARVTATNPARVSAVTDPFEVSPVPRPILFTADTLFLCAGETATLDPGPDYIAYAWSTGATARTITVSQSGRYSVQVTNAAGCSGTSPEVIVHVYDAIPRPTITRLTDYLIESSLADAYQWMRNGEDLVGETRRTYFVTESGSFTVRVTFESGCSALSDPFIVARASAPALSRQRPSLVPLPARDRVEVRLPIDVGQTWRLRLVDMLGRTVLEERGVCLREGTIGNVDLRRCAPSFHLLEVSTSNGRWVEGVPVER